MENIATPDFVKLIARVILWRSVRMGARTGDPDRNTKKAAGGVRDIDRLVFMYKADYRLEGSDKLELLAKVAGRGLIRQEEAQELAEDYMFFMRLNDEAYIIFRDARGKDLFLSDDVLVRIADERGVPLEDLRDEVGNRLQHVRVFAADIAERTVDGLRDSGVRNTPMFEQLFPVFRRLPEVMGSISFVDGNASAVTYTGKERLTR
jgi:glutamine synthetase adenylyltransferase